MLVLLNTHTRRRRVDPLDTDLLTQLEVRDRQLYALIHEATRYRTMLREEMARLRAGDDPAKARTEAERWAPVLRQIKRIAQGLAGERRNTK